MAIILNIETSTEVCSVALSNEGRVISFREDDKEKLHASRLTPFIEEVLTEAGVKIQDLSAICVSEGPGSYTGLRIGVSVAKGLCFGLNIPLMAISSLKAMAQACVQNTPNPDDYLFCPLIDARRMEVYTSLYDSKLNTIEKIHARIIDQNSFQDILQSAKVVFFGNGAPKCKEVTHSSNAKFDLEIRCSAVYMAGLADEAFKNKTFKNVAYFEPYYLKDFVATKPKQKIL